MIRMTTPPEPEWWCRTQPYIQVFNSTGKPWSGCRVTIRGKTHICNSSWIITLKEYIWNKVIFYIAGIQIHKEFRIQKWFSQEFQHNNGNITIRKRVVAQLEQILEC